MVYWQIIFNTYFFLVYKIQIRLFQLKRMYMYVFNHEILSLQICLLLQNPLPRTSLSNSQQETWSVDTHL